MYARFDTPEKAVNYVVSGLRKDYPDAIAEVTLGCGGKARTETCDVRQIVPVLTRFCRQFPMASVEYHPENRYGFVAEIRCHGEKHRKTVFERHTHDRPRVAIFLVKVHDQDTLVGSAAIVPHSQALNVSELGARRNA